MTRDYRTDTRICTLAEIQEIESSDDGWYVTQLILYSVSGGEPEFVVTFENTPAADPALGEIRDVLVTLAEILRGLSYTPPLPGYPAPTPYRHWTTSGTGT